MIFKDKNYVLYIFVLLTYPTVLLGNLNQLLSEQVGTYKSLRT